MKKYKNSCGNEDYFETIKKTKIIFFKQFYALQLYTG